MQHDPRGLVLTTGSAEAAAAMERAVMALLASRADAGAQLAAALAADPGLVAAHAMAGFAQMIGARADLAAQAALSLARATDGLARRGGTDRERALVQSLAAWVDGGDMQRAAAGLEAITQQHPTDALALRLAHAVCFMLGDAPAMRHALEQALPRWDRDLPGHAYLEGCLAFALEETGEATRAEALGRQAVARAPDDLWGAHAVAHALGAQGRMREGLAWLRWLAPHMAGGGAMVRHVDWHRALFHLALGQGEEALALHDARIWPEGAPEVRDVINAASLLWRLEAAGVPVGLARWERLAEAAAPRRHDGAWAFADLHVLVALLGARRRGEAAELLAGIALRAARGGDDQALLHAEVGLEAARGIAAAMTDDPARGAVLLDAVAPRLAELGGSHAQRALFLAMRDRAVATARAGLLRG
jgi:hypothetical protein